MLRHFRSLFPCVLLAVFLPAISGAQAAVRYVDNGDETVSDTATGLLWSRSEQTASLTWREALAACENLSLAGYDDWRLPEIRELRSLVDISRQNPAIDTTVFPDTEHAVGHWSSSTRHGSPNFAWYVGFGSGTVYTLPKTEKARVRCVR